MRIQVFDIIANKPFSNTRVQILVSGPAGGVLTFTTDSKGLLDLDDKFKGQQIAFSFNGSVGEFTIAADGAILKTNIKEPTEF